MSLKLGTILIAVLLAACAPAVQTTPVAGVGDLQAAYAKFRQYYHEGTIQEGNLSILQRQYENALSTFSSGLHDLVLNNKVCFKDVAATESIIAERVMTKDDQAGLINALVTQSVSGEAATTECVKGNRQIADYIIANRAAVQNAANQLYEAATKYNLYLSDYPEVKFVNDLLQTYGSPETVYKNLAENGIGVTDIVWLPTRNLKVIHSNKKVCDYYLSGQFMSELTQSMMYKFTGHEDALMGLYEVSWNSATGLCTMTRQAALEWMMRPILSGQAANTINTGVDNGMYPTEEPPATPAP